MRISCLVLTLFLGLAFQVDAQQTYKVKKVVLDAGHGGKDPGCHGHHSKEKEIVLNITLALGKKIEAAFPDVDVIYTRTKDVFIALNERAAIANRNKADVFISIHCNYIGARNKASGTETFVMGLHRADDNLDVAKRENASILLEEDFEKTYEGFDPYSVEGHIILSMFQNAHLQQSIMLANYIENSFKKLCGLPSRGVKQAGFLVLRETTMPSVLIESGFLSTDIDENFLMKPENQDKVAEAILRAFRDYKKEVEDQQADLLEASASTESAKELPAETKKENPPAVTKPVAQKTEVKTTTASNTEIKTTPSVKADVVEKPVVQSDPAKLIYRIQIAAASKPNLDARYHTLKDLEVIKEYELYKFVVGKYSSKEEAMPRLNALRADGYTGCFIVAYKEGQRIRA